MYPVPATRVVAGTIPVQGPAFDGPAFTRLRARCVLP